MNVKEELKAISKKTGVDVPTLSAEFEAKVAEFVSRGTAQPMAENIALKQIKGSYQARLKSNAKTYEGFFIGVTSKRNSNKFDYQDAMEKIDEYRRKHGENWIDRAVQDQVTNQNGEPLYNRENTKESRKFLWGKVIKPEDFERVGYGFFREVKDGEKDPVQFGLIHSKAVDTFLPIVGRMYQFFANGKDRDGVLTLNHSAANARLEDKNDKVDFDVVMELAKKYMKPNLGKFNDIYNMDNHTTSVDTNRRFFVTFATVSRYGITDGYDIDFVDLTSLEENDYDNIITMQVEKVMNKTVFADAIGLVVYQPYFKKDGSATASLIGFFPDSRYGEGPEEVKAITAEVFGE